MTARQFQRTSNSARWSRRFALFAGQLLLVDVLLHRLQVIATPAAMYIMGLAIVFTGLALLFAAVALTGIWRHGIQGASYAVAGVFVSLLVLAGPLYYLPDLLIRPRINDIVTSPGSPPEYQSLAARRTELANPVRYPGARFAEQQARAYPNLRPMILERSAKETFDLVREAVERLKWEVVEMTPPEGDNPGRIEAVAKTMIMGFADDVVVRVSSRPGESQIDVRSASRYGEHDFGANARRIARLFGEVKAGLEKGEKTALEIALARRAREAREKTRAEREQARKQREKAEKQELQQRQAILEEERKQLRLLADQPTDPSQLAPVPQATPSEPKRRVRRRDDRWNLPADRFFQRFAE